jgi:two-component system chemotaxis response regulator CheY
MTNKLQEIITKQTVFLVVDDFEPMRKVTAGQLRSMGGRIIVTANDGAEALRMLQNQRVDIVLSDWNMPVMTGLELLKTLRAMPEHAHLPFLIVTAEARRDNIVAAAHEGADGYIVKPFTAVTLIDKVSAILLKRGVLPRGAVCT